MTYGYARCSTNETKQDINRQVRELKAAGAEEIFIEYEHGDSAVKQELSSLLEQASEGDTIYYDSIVPHLVSPRTEAGAKLLAVVYIPV